MQAAYASPAHKLKAIPEPRNTDSRVRDQLPRARSKNKLQASQR